MHKSPFRLGLYPRPRWGAYSTPPGPLAVFKGPTSMEREGGDEEGKREGKGGEGKGRERDSSPPPPMRNPGYATGGRRRISHKTEMHVIFFFAFIHHFARPGYR